MDWSRPYATIYDGGPKKYEQDGILFDQNGEQVNASTR